MNVLKKIDQYFKRKPLYRLASIVTLTTIIQLIMNLFKHQSIFSNMEFPLSLIALFGICWLLYLSKLPHLFQFMISFSLTFTFLTLQMLNDGSYVNYTSLIIGGLVATFISFMILIGVWSISRQEHS